MQNPNRDLVAAKEIEEAVAKKIEKAFLVEVTMMPKYSAFDYLISRDIDGMKTAVAIAEFRNRPTLEKNEYVGLPLDAAKLKKITEARSAMDLDALLFVKFKDSGVMWIQIDQWNDTMSLKRCVKDREEDKEEFVVLYPVSKFKPLLEYNNG